MSSSQDKWQQMENEQKITKRICNSCGNDYTRACVLQVKPEYFKCTRCLCKEMEEQSKEK